MKILVDEMPFWETDCPFFDFDDCKLDGNSCDYMKRNAGSRCEEECRWLKRLPLFEPPKENEP